jgi:hypothetical protein
MIQYADVFLNADHKDDQQLVSNLLLRGVRLEAAERLVAFLPIAFGRVVLRALAPMNLSESFLIEETGKLHPLKGEKFFHDAEVLARDSYQTGLPSKDVFSSIALRSPELSAANNALNAGVPIDKAVLSPVVLWSYKTLGTKSLFGRLFSRR